mmetsp:Transcript_10379/g.23455  ORF Transcript_10379/g.23455 Transcript_10379/m.23455 type:complete len:756 (-) Transcript_10379:57-2324(-)
MAPGKVGLPPDRDAYSDFSSSPRQVELHFADFEDNTGRILREAAKDIQRQHTLAIESHVREIQDLRRQLNGTSEKPELHDMVCVDIDTFEPVQPRDNNHMGVLLSSKTVERGSSSQHLSRWDGSPTQSEATSARRNRMTRGAEHRATAFELLDEWQGSYEALDEIELAEMAQLRYHAGLTLLLNKHQSSMPGKRSLVRFGIMLPHAPQRIAWDLMAAFFLSVEICLLPMAVFELPKDGANFWIAVLMMFYWTTDIPANFCVGFVKPNSPDGDVELRFPRIAYRYLTTWFCMDLLIVLTDWTTTGIQLITGSSGNSFLDSAGLLRLGKMARFLRLIRVLRLIRFGKLRGIIGHIQDLIDMEHTAILFSICKNLVVIVLINHFMACAWFWVGKQCEEAGWLKDRLSEHWYENYLNSIHWSISNFTPGSSPVHPVATEEVLFAVVILFFALVVFSVFVSSTTSLISRLVGLQSTRNKQLWILKGFLRQHKFDVELRDRVLRYVKIALGARRDVIQRDDVELLGLLSQPLREEVQMNLHSRLLNHHPFFKLLATSSSVLMRKICVEAIEETSFSRGDRIFSVGEVFDKIGFVSHGVLGYESAFNKSSNYSEAVETSPGGRYTSEHHDPHILLKERETFCEAVLWTSWHCRGMMQADADCHVINVVASSFRKMVLKHHMDVTMVQRYAKAFLEVLNMAQSGLLDEPLTDLQGSFLNEEPILKMLAEPWNGVSHMSTMSSGASNDFGAPFQLASFPTDARE